MFTKTFSAGRDGFGLNLKLRHFGLGHVSRSHVPVATTYAPKMWKMSARDTVPVEAQVCKRKILHTGIYRALGHKAKVEIDLSKLDDHGIPGVSITTREVDLSSGLTWEICWNDSTWMLNQRRKPLSSMRLPKFFAEWSKYPLFDEEEQWVIPEDLDKILLAAVQDQSRTVKCGAATVYTNASHHIHAAGVAIPQDGHLRLRELHAHELPGTCGGIIAQELRDLGLEGAAFVAFNEDNDPGELSNAVVLSEYQLGSVIERTPQASTYSARCMSTQPSGETLRARGYVLDDIDARWRQYRARSITRLLSRTLATAWLWGQYVVIYRADSSKANEAQDTSFSNPRALLAGKKRTDAQREKAKTKQRDRRRKARMKDEQDGEPGVHRNLIGPMVGSSTDVQDLMRSKQIDSDRKAEDWKTDNE